MTKADARRRLAQIIQREIGTAEAKQDDSVTFKSFWQNRFLPMYEKRWRPKTASELKYFFDGRILPLIGLTALGDITRFHLQKHLNDLAEARASNSVVRKFRTWVKAVLDEAVEQRFLERNPARRLIIPETRPACKRFLSLEKVCTLLRALVHPCDRLIVRLFVLCALRRGELFALRWNDWHGDRLRVDEAIVVGKIGPTKTTGSTAEVAVPKSLQKELEYWRVACGDVKPDDFIFSSRRRTPVDGHKLSSTVPQTCGGEDWHPGSDLPGASADVRDAGTGQGNPERCSSPAAARRRSYNAGYLHAVNLRFRG